MKAPNTLITPRRTIAVLALALALASGCGGSDGGDDGADDGGDNPPVDTGGDGAAPECRTEIVEDEYGFEVEVEVCDDE